MIIFFPSYNLLYLAIGVGLLFLVVGSAWYVIKDTIARFPEWLETDYSTSHKAGLLLLVCLTLGGMGAVVFGWMYNNGTVVVMGVLLALFCGLFCATMGSPIQLVTAVPNAGCIGSLLVMPSTIISCLLALLFGWIFAVVSAFRGSSLRFRIIAALILALVLGVVAGGPVAVVYGQIRQEELLAQQEEKQAEQDRELALQLVSRVVDSLADKVVAKVPLTQEEQDALDRLGYKHVLNMPVCVELVANEFSKRYCQDDFDGILDLLDYLEVNDVFFVGSTGSDVSIWFTNEFVEYLVAKTHSKGRIKSSGITVTTYQYGDREIEISKDGTFVLVDRKFTVDGIEYWTYAMCGTDRYRHTSANKYDKTLGDCYFVGETVTFKEAD